MMKLRDDRRKSLRKGLFTSADWPEGQVEAGTQMPSWPFRLGMAIPAPGHVGGFSSKSPQRL